MYTPTTLQEQIERVLIQLGGILLTMRILSQKD